MDKRKVIPLVIAALLFVIAILVFIRNQKNNKTFEKLIVTYKSQNSDYKKIKVDDVIVVGSVSFWVVSTLKDSIVINSSDTLLDEGKESTEFEIRMNESKTLCFKEQDCVVFNLG